MLAVLFPISLRTARRQQACRRARDRHAMAFRNAMLPGSLAEPGGSHLPARPNVLVEKVVRLARPRLYVREALILVGFGPLQGFF